MSSDSFKIFEISRISVELHWSFVLIMLLLLIFSSLTGFLVIVLLYVCVLIHELSHSITAQRNGLTVNKIVLWPLWGLSHIDDININPLIEFNVSVAGPLMSLLLGCIFGVAVLFTPPGLMTQTVQTLFALNMLLGVLNLLPAFPMDGGRAFRSYLQRSRGIYASTMLTGRVTKYMTWLMLFGIFLFLFWPSPYSLNYKLLVFFLNFMVIMFIIGGMNAEEENVITRIESKDMTLKDAVSDEYILVDGATKVGELYRIVTAKRKYIVIAKLGGKFFLANLFSGGKQTGSVSVNSLSVPIPNLPVDTKVADALYKLETNELGLAAVVNGGKLIGIVTSRHLRSLISLHMMSKKYRKGF